MDTNSGMRAGEEGVAGVRGYFLLYSIDLLGHT